MRINSAQEMLDFGHTFAKKLTSPAVVELVGDVGAGKTTFARGLAIGLGIKTPVTSPSFTISKTYSFKDDSATPKTLTHYDFYRLSDPGLMSEDLIESLADKNTITVVEWADSVKNLLPKTRTKITFIYNPDGSRTVEIEKP